MISFPKNGMIAVSSVVEVYVQQSLCRRVLPTAFWAARAFVIRCLHFPPPARVPSFYFAPRKCLSVRLFDWLFGVHHQQCLDLRKENRFICRFNSSANLFFFVHGMLQYSSVERFHLWKLLRFCNQFYSFRACFHWPIVLLFNKVTKRAWMRK